MLLVASLRATGDGGRHHLGTITELSTRIQTVSPQTMGATTRNRPNAAMNHIDATVRMKSLIIRSHALKEKARLEYVGLSSKRHYPIGW